mmetsp:Transcript_24369/g.57368  ORF Transcript_24369/g.57368 Transcript_24369/m.57368 type:complete len:168 (-) Transcript_24369:1550-2053(-)
MHPKKSYLCKSQPGLPWLWLMRFLLTNQAMCKSPVHSNIPISAHISNVCGHNSDSFFFGWGSNRISPLERLGLTFEQSLLACVLTLVQLRLGKKFDDRITEKLSVGAGNSSRRRKTLLEAKRSRHGRRRIIDHQRDEFTRKNREPDPRSSDEATANAETGASPRLRR